MFKFKWTDDLEDVPGIGLSSRKILQAYGIENPIQLMGQFLLLKDCDETIQEHCDKMFRWLTHEPEVTELRSTIIRALGQKASTMIPGIYNEEYVSMPSLYLRLVNWSSYC